MTDGRQRHVLRIAGALASVALLALLVVELHPSRVAAALAGADWRLVAAAAALNLGLNTWARVRRWWALLAPLEHDGPTRTGPRELTALLLAAMALSNVLPARAGEALRTVELRRRHGYAVGALVAVQLVEKLIEAMSLGALALPMALLAGPAAWLRGSLWTFAIVVGGGVSLLLWLARREPTGPTGDGRVRAFFGRVVLGVHRVGRLRPLGAALAWSFVSDALDVATIGLCLHAFAVAAPPVVWFAVFLGVNVAIAVPATPGQVGLVEAAVVFVLGGFGVRGDVALAVAITYHAVHLVPTTIAGLLTLRFSDGSERARWRAGGEAS